MMIFFVLVGFGLAMIRIVRASSEDSEPLKLPYSRGQSFVVVQGYDSPPTHIKKDLYAIDFSQNGCDAYGKIAVAASSGVVVLAEESGYRAWRLSDGSPS